MSVPPVRVLYLINGFDNGGAEIGLVHLVRLGGFGSWQLSIRGLVAGGGQALGQLRELGADVAPLVPVRRMRPWHLAIAFVRLCALMRRERPDLLVLSLPQANILGRLATWLWRPRVVASFEHNTHLAKPVYEKLYRLTSPRVDVLVSDAPSTARIAGERLYRKLPAVRTVLPLVSFPDRPLPPKAPTARFRLVNAGRFTRVKNQGAVIEALAQVVGQGIDAELTLFGDGPELPNCRELAARLKVEDRVHFAGFRSDWTQGLQADLFVLASLHEGLCITALESMDAGVPLLAPVIGGLADYGGPDVMWVLEDVTAATIAAGIAAAAQSPERNETYRRAGFERVSRMYGEGAALEQCATFRRQVVEVMDGKKAAATTAVAAR